MKSPLKSNVLLAAVLIALSSFAYWFEFKHKAEKTRDEEAQTRLIRIEPTAEPESVRLVSKEKSLDLEMQCKEHCKLSDPAAQWELLKPIHFRADEANVGTFITTLAGTNIQETLPLEGDKEAALAGFGLGKDKRDNSKAVLKFKGSAPYTVYFGESSAVGDNMYAYVEGPGQKTDVVRIIPGHLRANMERKLSYWRAKRLFSFLVSEVESVKLVNPSGTVELTKKPTGWVLGGGHMADNEAVETFLTGVAFMTAQDFASDDKKADRAKLNLPARPKYELTIKPAKKDAVKLAVYDTIVNRTQPKVFAILADKNFVAELDRPSVERFGKKAESFRFRNLITPAEKIEVEKIEATFGSEKLAFERERDIGWKLVYGNVEGFDPGAPDQALTKIGSARVAEFNGKRGAPKGAALLSTWKLSKKDGTVLRSFSVYASKDKATYYARLQNDEQAVLERGSGSVIPTKPADFKKGAPAPVTPAGPAAAPHAHDEHGH